MSTELERAETAGALAGVAQVHMIVGNVGAGKSTYAAKLAAERNAHIFAVDEWMRTLFFPDMPDPAPYEWALERTERIEDVILVEASRLSGLGMEIILDLGFFSRIQRDRVRGELAAAGRETQLHYLNVDRMIRWARVEERNRERGPTYQFDVSIDVFEFCETIFEPPGADELEGAVVVS